MKKPTRTQIDYAMKQVPEMPKGYREYIKSEILKRNRYLFYKREGKKTKAVCSKCGEIVELKRATHNEQSKCPSCKTKAVTKAINKAKMFNDTQIFTIVQKIKLGESKGVVIRYVKAEIRFKQYEDTSNFPNEILETLSKPAITYWEGSREIIYEHYSTIKRWLLEFEYKWKEEEWQWVNERKRSGMFNRGLLRDSNPIFYKKNLKTVFKETPWKYCGLDHFKLDNCNIGYYIEQYYDHKELEYLVKTRLQNVANELVNRNYGYPGSVICKVNKLTKESLKLARRFDCNSSGIETLLKMQENGVLLTEEQFKWLIKYHNTDKIIELMKIANISLTKIINHIEKQEEQKEYAASLWVDLIVMCLAHEKDLTKSFILFPRNIKQKHDELSESIRKKKEQDVEDGLVAVWEKWHEILEYQSKGLKLIVPRSQEEFIREGKALKICVWSNGYATRMAKGLTMVLMIRKNNEPYFTLEVDPQITKAKQLHGWDHTEAPANVKKFVKSWMSKVQKELKKHEEQKSA